MGIATLRRTQTVPAHTTSTCMPTRRSRRTPYAHVRTLVRTHVYTHVYTHHVSVHMPTLPFIFLLRSALGLASPPWTHERAHPCTRAQAQARRTLGLRGALAASPFDVKD